MQKFEYATLTYCQVHSGGQNEYVYRFQRESGKQILRSTWVVGALNELGSLGWIDYREGHSESSGGSRTSFTDAEIDVVEQRFGWKPTAISVLSWWYLRRASD